jgi:RNA polymerase sigma-70 factor (ECF subfamily)
MVIMSMPEPAAARRPAAGNALPSGEAALVERLKAGDDEAFEQLVRLHGPAMTAVIRRYLPSESDANDALQEAFLSAFKAIEHFQGAAGLGTWLHRIAVNAALMKLRTRRRKPETSIDDLLPKFLEDGHREVAASTRTLAPDRIAENEETRHAVREAIRKLPESFRTVLLLRDIEERSTEETAELLGLSVANVKTRLHRARQALAELLARRFGEESP